MEGECDHTVDFEVLFVPPKHFQYYSPYLRNQIITIKRVASGPSWNDGGDASAV